MTTANETTTSPVATPPRSWKSTNSHKLRLHIEDLELLRDKLYGHQGHLRVLARAIAAIEGDVGEDEAHLLDFLILPYLTELIDQADRAIQAAERVSASHDAGRHSTGHAS